MQRANSFCFSRAAFGNPFFAAVRTQPQTRWLTRTALTWARLSFDDARPDIPHQLALKTDSGSPLTQFPIYSGIPMHGLLTQVATVGKSANVCLLAVHKDAGLGVVRWCRSVPLDIAVRDSLVTGALLELEVHADNSTMRIPIELPSVEERTMPLKRRHAVVETKLQQMQLVKDECDAKSQRATVRLVWGGLAALCAQWGLMARLTWWEYSWDIMEPIAYFITFGTAIGGYMFFVVTRREYTYEVLSDLLVTRRQQRLYNDRGLDILEYSSLCKEIESIQSVLESVSKEAR